MRFVLLLVLLTLFSKRISSGEPQKIAIVSTEGEKDFLINIFKGFRMGKISENFDLREFIPRHTFEKWGENSRWFLDPNLIKVAEFYKRFWTAFYKKKYGNRVKSVSININNWHLSGGQQYRGYRPPDYTEGGKESQHRFGRAFDCDIVINFLDGTNLECDYKEVHRVIKEYEDEFIANGVSTVEDVSFAPTWLHTDIRTTGLNNILVVKPL